MKPFDTTVNKNGVPTVVTVHFVDGEVWIRQTWSDAGRRKEESIVIRGDDFEKFVAELQRFLAEGIPS
jgi:hypothetical protein